MNPAEKIIGIVFKAAESLNIPLMLVGAASRDFWMKQFEIHANVRTTSDVDLACWISTWEDYRKLLFLLVQEHHLLQDSKITHRLWLKGEISVDIVPFGGIEMQKGEIAWPPDFDKTLNVLGFQAAYNNALETHIGMARIRIIRPCWLAFLKMNAYTDNLDRTKDLTDLYFLADNYLDLIDAEALLYAPDAPDGDILSMDNFDTRIGGALLIARHCRRSDDLAAKALQENVRMFNAKGAMTNAFSAKNAIPLEIGEAIMSSLLSDR